MSSVVTAPVAVLRFDPVAHRYFLGDQELPNVTRIIEPCCAGSPWYTEEARERGRDVHEATQFHDEGTLDPASLDDETAGCLRGWCRFLAESRFTIQFIELPVHSRLMYAGKPDRVGLLNSKRAILELKSGEPEPWHGVQLAGYNQAVQECLGVPPLKRYGVYLRANGTYRTREYREPEDFPEFLRMLGHYWWMNRHGAAR
jgi:hypothetical protein